MLKEWIENAVFEFKFLIRLNRRFLAEVPQQKCFKENILTLPIMYLLMSSLCSGKDFSWQAKNLGFQTWRNCFCLVNVVFFFLPSFLSPFFFQFFSVSFIVLFLLTPTSPSQDSALNVGYITHILTFNRQ